MSGRVTGKGWDRDRRRTRGSDPLRRGEKECAFASSHGKGNDASCFFLWEIFSCIVFCNGQVTHGPCKCFLFLVVRWRQGGVVSVYACVQGEMEGNKSKCVKLLKKRPSNLKRKGGGVIKDLFGQWARKKVHFLLCFLERKGKFGTGNESFGEEETRDEHVYISSTYYYIALYGACEEYARRRIRLNYVRWRSIIYRLSNNKDDTHNNNGAHNDVSRRRKSCVSKQMAKCVHNK